MIEVVGHRGAKALCPENTLPGFELAISLGCQATECDIHLSADGRLMVCHDPTLDRTTSGTGAIADQTSAQIRAVDAGDGAQVPFLEELLEVVAGRITLLCEMKAAGTPRPAVAAVRAAGLVDTVCFSSFNVDLLAQVRALGDDLRLAAIFGAQDAGALPRLKQLGVEAVDVQWTNLSSEFVELCHEQGFVSRGWNPDSVEHMQATLALGVDSLSSNRPDLALTTVRAWEARSGEK